MTPRRAMLVLVGGLLLGLISRIEERTVGFSIGVSSDSAWVAVAFLAGALAATGPIAAAQGALALTIANASYYVWIAATEAIALDAAAGPIEWWITLGLAGGVVYGVCGWLWASRQGVARALATAPLAAVMILDGWDSLTDSPAGAIGLALGAILPATSAPPGYRSVALVLTLAIGAALVSSPLPDLLP